MTNVVNNKLILSLKNISKSYVRNGKEFFAVEDVNLDVEKGDFLLITGESGAGKSTLLNIIGLLTTQNSGNLTLDGKEVSVLSKLEIENERRSKISNIFQESTLVEALTVRENIDLIGRFNKKKSIDIEKAIEAFGMQEVIDSLPNSLSGGQKRRAMILTSIAKEADILLLDEPTNDLDSYWANSVLGFLKSLTENGTTIVMVSHDSGSEKYCNKIFAMDKGHIKIK